MFGFSYDQFLGGIDFKKIVAELSHSMEKADHYAKQLAEVNATLGPVLATLSKQFTGRRLAAALDQKAYQTAIEQIIPAWQGVEGLGIKMCPEVLSAKTTALSLVCRVGKFVGNNGALGQLSNLLGDCPVDSADRSSDAAKCPAKAMSSGVQDLLSKNAGALGWIMYVVAALGGLGVLGGGGFAALKQMQGDGETESDSDDSPLQRKE